jgi:hypothetical protein
MKECLKLIALQRSLSPVVAYVACRAYNAPDEVATKALLDALQALLTRLVRAHTASPLQPAASPLPSSSPTGVAAHGTSVFSPAEICLLIAETIVAAIRVSDVEIMRLRRLLSMLKSACLVTADPRPLAPLLMLVASRLTKQQHQQHQQEQQVARPLLAAATSLGGLPILAEPFAFDNEADDNSSNADSESEIQLLNFSNGHTQVCGGLLFFQ